MFGALVRIYRQRRAMTQEDLADKAGLSARHIRDLEAGRTTRPRPSTVRLVAAALGLDGDVRERFHRAALAGPEPPGSALPGEPDPAVAAQLPMDVSGFAGRADYLAGLDAVLDSAKPATGVVVATLSGTAGVGKTALALHWAHRVSGRFPDGQLYLNLRGFDEDGWALPPTDALGGLLEMLGVPPDGVPANLEARSAFYRGVLNGKRVLVVLDNARDAGQVRPLLPGSAGCLVLITSRDALNGLAATVGAVPLTVDLMSPVEAGQLLTSRLGADRVGAEPAAVNAIVRHCAGLPLALAVVAARAARRPRFPLAALADELHRYDGSLDRFADPDPSTDVRAVFSWSYRTLSATAARVFQALSTHPGPHIAAPDAADLAGTSVVEAEASLVEMARAHLVTETEPGSYTLHALLRAYAAELVRANPPPPPGDGLAPVPAIGPDLSGQ